MVIHQLDIDVALKHADDGFTIRLRGGTTIRKPRGADRRARPCAVLAPAAEDTGPRSCQGDTTT
jgi:hypothetical protein